MPETKQAAAAARRAKTPSRRPSRGLPLVRIGLALVAAAGTASALASLSRL